MKIEQFTVNHFGENTYIAYDDDSRECAVIDPGCYTEAERNAKIEDLEKEKAKLQAELPSIKGLFAGSKKAKINPRLAEIEAELKKLG